MRERCRGVRNGEARLKERWGRKAEGGSERLKRGKQRKGKERKGKTVHSEAKEGNGEWEGRWVV